MAVPVGALPSEAGEGAWLLVGVSSSGAEVLGADPEGEARQRERMERRLARLLGTGGGRLLRAVTIVRGERRQTDRCRATETS